MKMDVKVAFAVKVTSSHKRFIFLWRATSNQFSCSNFFINQTIIDKHLDEKFQRYLDGSDSLNIFYSRHINQNYVSFKQGNPRRIQIGMSTVSEEF